MYKTYTLDFYIEKKESTGEWKVWCMDVDKVDLTKYIEEHNFTFDGAYHEYSTNEDVYNSSVKPLIAAFSQVQRLHALPTVKQVQEKLIQ